MERSTFAHGRTKSTTRVFFLLDAVMMVGSTSAQTICSNALHSGVFYSTGAHPCRAATSKRTPTLVRYLYGRAHQLPSRMWHMPAPLLGDVLLRLRRRLRRRRPRLRVWHHLPVRHRLHRLRPALAALALARPPGADHSVHGNLRAPHDMGQRWFVRRRWSGRRVRKLRAR